jgi:putative flippase GtrA
MDLVRQSISGHLLMSADKSRGGVSPRTEHAYVDQAGGAAGTTQKGRNLSVQFVGFLVAGSIAAACNIGSRWLLSRTLPYEIAIVLAYLVGMVVAFGIMRNLVFQPSTKLSKSAELGRFALVNILGLAQTVVVSLLVARWLVPALGVHRHAEEVGHIIGVGVPIFTSFVGHRRFSFSKENQLSVPQP